MPVQADGKTVGNDTRSLISLETVCFDSTASEFFCDETTILHRPRIVSVE